MLLHSFKIEFLRLYHKCKMRADKYENCSQCFRDETQSLIKLRQFSRSPSLLRLSISLAKRNSENQLKMNAQDDRTFSPITLITPDSDGEIIDNNQTFNCELKCKCDSGWDCVLSVAATNKRTSMNPSITLVLKCISICCCCCERRLDWIAFSLNIKTNYSPVIMQILCGIVYDMTIDGKRCHNCRFERQMKCCTQIHLLIN